MFEFNRKMTVLMISGCFIQVWQVSPEYPFAHLQV